WRSARQFPPAPVAVAPPAPPAPPAPVVVVAVAPPVPPVPPPPVVVVVVVVEPPPHGPTLAQSAHEQTSIAAAQTPSSTQLSMQKGSFVQSGQVQASVAPQPGGSSGSWSQAFGSTNCGHPGTFWKQSPQLQSSVPPLSG